MITEFTYYIILSLVGIACAIGLGVVSKSPASRNVYSLALSSFTLFLNLFVLFMSYYISGLVVHPCCGTGWIEWSNPVGGMFVVYVPIILFSAARSLREQ